MERPAEHFKSVPPVFTPLLFRSGKLTLEPGAKRVEASVWVLADVLLMAVEQTVSEQKHLHPKLVRNHVFIYVVADHKAFVCSAAKPVHNFGVILKIRLAEANVLIRRI